MSKNQKFFDLETVQQATDFFNNWVVKVEQSQNTRLIKVAKTFEKHLQGLLNYTKHRVSKAMAECINTVIQQINVEVVSPH
ncbi:MAG: transposase [Bacteroidota bacterium]